MLDRTIAPSIKSFDKINIPAVQIQKFPNEIPFYFLNIGEQDVSRIDIMIKAGKWDQPGNLISSFTNQLLKDGAGNLDSESIAEQLDYYGAWLQLSDTYHYSYITIYTPNKFFKEILGLLEVMIKDPRYPEAEFITNLQRNKQQFLIDKERVQVIALNAFVNTLFGDRHPYGIILKEDDFDKISTPDLSDFHRSYYNSANTNIILSGKITDEMIRDVENMFGSEKWGTINPIESKNYKISSSKDHYHFSEKTDALQNAIRMGLLTIGRKDPDFRELRILNTVLGGYFGSRLMSNIREEKGYTYGISSGITSLKNNAYLTISSQTSPEYTSDVIKEVKSEIIRLQNELIPDEELNRVKNYMLGDMARSIDSVFSIADIYISLLASELPLNYYENYAENIADTNSSKLQELCRKYIDIESLYTIVAGKK